MIKAERLSKKYGDGTVALDGVSLTINQGEFVAVIGRSGSGKTTLLRQINGSLAPTDGRLHVLGVDVRQARSADLKRLRRQIGFVYQQFNLVKRLSVFQNVLCGRLGYMSSLRGALGLFSQTDKDRAAHFLKEVGLEGRFDSRADQLSGGQQQRVAIARALIQDPKIILADEPMASLDPRLSEVVLGMLKTFNEKQNITVLVNIHVLEYAKRYAGRIIGLNKGKVVYDGKAEGLTDAILKQIYD